MHIAPFELERWQSLHEHRVRYNLSESGVAPLSLRELLDDPGGLEAWLDQRLGYPQTNGRLELRERIAALYPAAGAENVLVTCGCSEANFLVCWALLHPGDEVVLMQPNYLQVGGVARSFGVRVQPFWLREEHGFAPDVGELRRLITAQTRLVAVCNPNNPTGAVLGEEAMARICAEAAMVGAYVLADEVYRGAELAGPLTPSFHGRYERLICTGGLSKAYGLPGLRTGWALGPPELIERLWAAHDYTTIAPTALGERLAAHALEPERRARILERTRSMLVGNHARVRGWLAERPELRHQPPRAGAIAWVGYAGGRPSAELAEELRVREDVLVVPGSQLGVEFFLRIGFGGDPAELALGLERVGRVLGAAR